MDDGASVGAAELHGLAAARFREKSSTSRGLTRRREAPEVGPAEGDPDHGAPVEVAPADAGRGLLVGHEAEVGRRDRVAEGGQGVGVFARGRR